ncbi:MAG: DUF362 domain-containing protein [Actinomycetia bacterium]|nr:DUF362 domain-containing protein [Actinomycetes bacterium]
MPQQQQPNSGTASAAKVYFTSMKLKDGQSLPSKLDCLCRSAGLADIDFDRQFTAIKIHFGEAGNLAYLRPNYAKVLVDLVRELGGRPFLTDCNTLYPGRRKNALEHLELAYEHGFSPFSTGCHIIIGDGLTGSDEVLVPVNGGQYLKAAKIGRAIMDADILISLNHFKGHIETGFGGAIKNIGMGAGSRAGKMEMHASTGPKINSKACIGCQKCSRYCASDAIGYPEPDKKAVIDSQKCVECGHCISACPTDAIYSGFDEASELLAAKIAEYTKAVLDGRPHFHINLVIDVSPLCDCWSANDLPIVPDVGFFASKDPVALDMASADAVNAQPVNANSDLAAALGGHGHGFEDQDYFMAINSHSDWRKTLEHAEKLGLGSCRYDLVEVG